MAGICCSRIKSFLPPDFPLPSLITIEEQDAYDVQLDTKNSRKLTSQYPNFDPRYPSLMLPLHWPLYLAPPSTSISGFSTRSANFAPAPGSGMFRVPIPDTRVKRSSFVLVLLREAANTKAATNLMFNQSHLYNISHRYGFAK